MRLHLTPFWKGRVMTKGFLRTSEEFFLKMQITNISAQKYFLQDFLQSEISISSLDYFN